MDAGIIRRVRSRAGGHGPYLAALLLALFGVGLCSLFVGASGLPFSRSLSGLLVWDGSPDNAMIRDVRLPRMVLTMLVGANLAIAGALIQTLTRNPLASPQTFGINAGAAMAIVVTMIAFPGLSGWGSVGPAFAGAFVVGLLLWLLSSAAAMTTMRMALAGVALHLALSALVQGILIANNSAADVLYWMAGSATSAQWHKVWIVLPFTLAGTAAALIGARSIGLLALGPEVGAALGQNVHAAGALTALLVVLLSASAVAVCGPVGFVGLMVPHMVRLVVGEDQRRTILGCLFAGPLLLTGADLAGRLINYPAEVPAGVITAVVGAPAFLFIAMRGGR